MENFIVTGETRDGNGKEITLITAWFVDSTIQDRFGRLCVEVAKAFPETVTMPIIVSNRVSLTTSSTFIARVIKVAFDGLNQKGMGND